MPDLPPPRHGEVPPPPPPPGRRPPPEPADALGSKGDGAGPEHRGPEHTGPEHTGPEHTGPEHTGPEHTGRPERAAPGLDDRERRLDRSILAEWRLASAAVAVGPALVVCGAAFALLDAIAWLVLAAVVLVVVVLVWWIPSARYARWRWRLTPLAIELEHGVVIRRHEAVPYFRIQQIDVNHGPLDRLLGLATLEVTTASASGSAGLPGIAAEEAPSVRAELLARAARAVGEHPGDLQDAV